MGSNGAIEEPRCKERNRRASERDAAEVWVLCKRKSFSLKVAHEQQSLDSNQLPRDDSGGGGGRIAAFLLMLGVYMVEMRK